LKQVSETVRALVSRGVADLRVSNRSPERAEALASAIGGGRSIPFEQWLRQCAEIDILITSTSSEVPLLTQEKLAPIVRERIDRPLFIIDIAVAARRRTGRKRARRRLSLRHRFFAIDRRAIAGHAARAGGGGGRDHFRTRRSV